MNILINKKTIFIFIIPLLIASTFLALKFNSSKNLGATNDMFEAADPAAGKAIVQGCTACHSIDKGGPDKVGPNLFGIVGERIAQRNGFEYSGALLKHQSDFWTIDNLSAWLKSPADFAPGTKMAFGGLLDPQDRMDLIAFLIAHEKEQKELPAR